MRATSHSLTAGVADPAVGHLLDDLAGPGGQTDPYPIHARLRALGDPLMGPDDSLIATGYRHCSALLREPRLQKSPGRLLAAAGHPDWMERPALRLMFTSLLMLNPPEHTRQRRLVAGTFTARRVAEMRPAVAAIADRLLEPLSGTFDFVETVAFPFPVTVIGELLGVPEADRLMFHGLVTEWTRVLEVLNPLAVEEADGAAQAIVDYFQDLVSRRRREPRHDLLSDLVRADAGDGTGLTDEELVSLAALILAAGFETTTGLLSNGVVALLGHPVQAARLRREPELARSAVDELLRYDAPVQITYGRIAVDNIAVGDLTLHAGQRVITLLGAANRDPAFFTDPDALILDRDEGVPLSFGAGIHHCLGAALARLEGQVMFPRLLQRFPDLHVTGEPQRRHSTTLRGYTALPLAAG